MSSYGESAFYERIDAYVLNALRKYDDFNSLMKNNGGIHPIDLMSSLHRLYKCKKIHKSKYRRLVQSAERNGQVAAEDMPNCLPVPHLLDYDWRFSRNGIENLARALRSSIQDSKATVAFIGTPSLFKYCIEALHKNTRLVLVDQNAEKHAAGITSDRTKYINVDISGSCKALKAIYADFIVMDPPWYKSYYELFFDRAMLMAQMDTCIVCVMPPGFTRPTAEEEREQLLKHLDDQYGLKKLHYYSGIVSYHTPPYEQNVLKANGIRCIPANWRIGDILVVQKKVVSRIFRTLVCRPWLEWSQPAIEVSSTAASRCFMFMYFLFPHWVPATCRSRAQTSMRAELPSGKLPTTRVRRRISRFSRSITLLVRIRVQCSLGKSQ